MTSQASALLLAAVVRLFGVKAGKFAKAVLPASVTVVAVAGQWVATGKFDRAEMVTAASGLGAAALSYLVPNLKSPDELDFIPTDDLTGPSVDPPPLKAEDEPIDVPEPPVLPDEPPTPQPPRQTVELPPTSAAVGPPAIAPEADEEPDPPRPSTAPAAGAQGATAPTSQ